MLRTCKVLIRDTSKEKTWVREAGWAPKVSSMRSLRACPMIGLHSIDVSDTQSEPAAAVAVNSPRPVPSKSPKNKPKTVRLSDTTVVGLLMVTRLLSWDESNERASV